MDAFTSAFKTKIASFGLLVQDGICHSRTHRNAKVIKRKKLRRKFCPLSFKGVKYIYVPLYKVLAMCIRSYIQIVIMLHMMTKLSFSFHCYELLFMEPMIHDHPAMSCICLLQLHVNHQVTIEIFDKYLTTGDLSIPY